VDQERAWLLHGGRRGGSAAGGAGGGWICRRRRRIGIWEGLERERERRGRRESER
jgi:hypothetical protein